MGFFSGVDQRSGLDSGREKFFLVMLKQKMLKQKNSRRKIFIWRSHPLSQSIGRGRISREGAIDVYIYESRERRDKIFAKKTEDAK